MDGQRAKCGEGEHMLIGSETERVRERNYNEELLLQQWIKKSLTQVILFKKKDQRGSESPY